MAADSISVRVTKQKDRRFFLAYYDCQLTGKRVFRSTKETTKRAAEKFAAKWEKDLEDGAYIPDSNVVWSTFRETFERQYLDLRSDAYYRSMCSAMNAFERHCGKPKLMQITSNKLDHFVRRLIEEGKSENTIASYVKHLKVVFNWAVKKKYLKKAPGIGEDLPEPEEKAKGRPITTEEFERMLDCCPDESWRHFITGLWKSGLRRAEALNLTWDDPTNIMVDMSGRRPLLSIPAKKQKRKKYEDHPITPEFARFLEETPSEDRRGYVFNPLGKRGEVTRDGDWVGRMVSEVGKKALVVVSSQVDEKTKFASCHDLRRSFGDRWSSKVMPALLQKLMRHRKIETTMEYYAKNEAEKVADELWALENVDTTLTAPSSPR